MCSIHHLSFDKNIRQGKIAIIHYDRGNILSGNFRREKSGRGIARLGSVRWGVFTGKVSVGSLSLGKCQSGNCPVLQSVNFNSTLGNFLRKYVSVLVLLCK